MVRTINGYPQGYGQPAAAITYQLNGAQVGRGNTLNIEGSGVTFTAGSDKGTYTISGGGGSGIPIITNYIGGAQSMYDQSDDILGIGFQGNIDAYSIDAFSGSLIGNLAGDFTIFGGADNGMISGYTSFGSGGVSNTTYNFDSVTGAGDISIHVSSGSTQAEIELEADGVTEALRFKFSGGQQYTFPATSPNTNDVLTAVAPGLLDWVPGGGSSGITIGDPISGGTAHRVLYQDSGNNLAESNNFIYNDGTGTFEITNGSGTGLLSSFGSGRFGIGDLNAVFNGNYLNIDDTNQVITTGVSDLYQILNTATAAQWLKLELSTSKFTIGDAGNVLNGNRFEINDNTEITTLYTSKEFQVLDNTANFRYLDINPGTNQYAIGDLNNFGNFNYFLINDFAQQSFVQTLGTFAVQTIGGQRVLSTDLSGGTNFIFQAGDVDGGDNNTKIILDDTGQYIHLESTGKVVIGDQLGLGNGTKIDVDDSTQRVTITNVPAFADDAAAGVGGLTTGQLYKTTTGGSTFLKIVP